MISPKKKFVLLIASFTFFGLSILQNIIQFSDFTQEIKINLNLTSEEEENHNVEQNLFKLHASNSLKSKFDSFGVANEQKSFAAVLKNFILLHPGYFEEFSPPPKV